ncbi:predicted protein [Lichtheimia corymbifera JMRC:FSU:9682]|uniref:3-oxo-5-alpha-steroid 4-dehydrogenase C-terminal domain-containing protein n=1 Tax=Lichtheimia corymbifera JMRC:FSU:9682 TaxID=1263082 RepID=A0A068RSE8_9FUNG|nr:predicted protein [Lichtheimia corymbifera JMRC:FSU:9682]
MGLSIWPGLYFNDISYLSIGSVVYGLAIVAAAFHSESSTKPTPYSKFGNGPKASLDSKVAMYIIYLPALASALYMREDVVNGVISRYTLVESFYFVHFAKRLLEVSYVHIYTSKTDVGTMLTISSTYFLTTTLTLLNLRRVPESVFGSGWLALGMLCTIIGELVNGYHHLLLRRLRLAGGNTAIVNKKLDDQRKYTLPSGGLFEYCIAPHYAAEQLSYIGIMLMCQNVAGIVLNLFPMVYLTLRSARTHEWYASKLSSQYERSLLQHRKRLIPGVW